MKNKLGVKICDNLIDDSSEDKKTKDTTKCVTKIKIRF